MNKEIAQMIKSTRKQKGLTSIELARMCGFKSTSHIARIESGMYSCNTDTLKKVCDALNIETILKNKER
jgi:transcriptional regulator with XRE-family HTH domain